MKLERVIVLLATIFGALKTCHCFTVIHEGISVPYMNSKYVSFTAKMYKGSDDRNYLNATTIIYDLAVTDMKARLKAVKINKSNGHRNNFLAIERTFKQVLDMESFDIGRILRHCTRPPVVLPIQKNVAYKTEKYTPDATTYPTNVPEGSYEVDIVGDLPDKTQILHIIWNMQVKK